MPTRLPSHHATRRGVLAGLVAVPIVPILPGMAGAEDRAVIDTRISIALTRLYEDVPEARALAQRAQALLVMPEVLKGGFILGGTYGEGALLLKDASGDFGLPAIGYYSVAGASFGLQAGVQTTSHVLFFMTEDALAQFRRSDGWEVGADAEVTFPDKGLNAQVNSTQFNKPVIAVVFAQDGVLAGASLEGAKYSPVTR